MIMIKNKKKKDVKKKQKKPAEKAEEKIKITKIKQSGRLVVQVAHSVFIVSKVADDYCATSQKGRPLKHPSHPVFLHCQL